MSGALYRHQMHDLARERSDEGQRLLALHRSQDDRGQPGICASCGRRTPCDASKAGAELVARYQPFLAGPEDPPDAPALVRPYVTAGGPVDGGVPWQPIQPR